MCVCVCVCERERVCVFTCVCVSIAAGDDFTRILNELTFLAELFRNEMPSTIFVNSLR